MYQRTNFVVGPNAQQQAMNPQLAQPNFGAIPNFWTGNSFNVPWTSATAQPANQGLFGGGSLPPVRGMSGVLAQLMMGGGMPGQGMAPGQGAIPGGGAQPSPSPGPTMPVPVPAQPTPPPMPTSPPVTQLPIPYVPPSPFQTPQIDQGGVVRNDGRGILSFLLQQQ